MEGWYFCSCARATEHYYLQYLSMFFSGVWGALIIEISLWDEHAPREPSLLAPSSRQLFNIFNIHSRTHIPCSAAILPLVVIAVEKYFYSDDIWMHRLPLSLCRRDSDWTTSLAIKAYGSRGKFQEVSLELTINQVTCKQRRRTQLSSSL